MNDKENPLKAGMFAKVKFTGIENREAVVIPREALVGSVKNPQVFVVDNGIARLRDLVVGDQAGTSIQVLHGLTEGETIVVSGQNNLVDGVGVEIVK